MNRLPAPLSKFLAGFVGTSLTFLLLPKTAKLFIRRFVLGLIGEVIFVIITALLTEKLAELVGHDRYGRER